VSALGQVRGEDLEGMFIVHLRGEVDISNIEEIQGALESVVPDTVAAVVIDLTETTFLGSPGVRLLFALIDRLHTRRRHVRVVAPSGGGVRAVLEVAGFPQVLPVTRTVEEAVADLKLEGSSDAEDSA
jgi:anti-anti-sigma factor